MLTFIYMRNTIRQIYFYAATLIFLIMSVVSLISLLNLGMRTFLFPKAELVYNSCDVPFVRAPIDAPNVDQPTRESYEADRAACEKSEVGRRDAQRQRELVQWLSMLLVAAPLFWLHFKWVQKERETELKQG